MKKIVLLVLLIFMLLSGVSNAYLLVTQYVGEWSPAYQYLPGEIVSYQGGVFVTYGNPLVGVCPACRYDGDNGWEQLPAPPRSCSPEWITAEPAGGWGDADVTIYGSLTITSKPHLYSVYVNSNQ